MTPNQKQFAKLLPRWISAYKAAWGTTPDPIPHYQGGWVRFPGMDVSNIRILDFKKSTETLEELAEMRGHINELDK